MTAVPVHIKIRGGGMMPTRGYPGDAGWDLYASETVRVERGQFADVPTGVHIALPQGFWAHMVGRSSSVRRRGLMVVPAVIDQGYTGELFFGVVNVGEAAVVVSKGERLAQLIPHRIHDVVWWKVDELPETERGARGFGSTGG